MKTTCIAVCAKVALFITSLASSSVVAEGPDHFLFLEGVDAIIAFRETFRISIDDQVSDGCLPYPGRLQDNAEISLRKNGFRIANKRDAFQIDFRLTALGYSTDKDYCIVAFRAFIVVPTETVVPFADEVPGGTHTLVYGEYPVGSVLMSGTTQSMQNRLEKSATDFADKLFLHVSRAKDKIYSKYPSMKKVYDARMKRKLEMEGYMRDKSP